MPSISTLITEPLLVVARIVVTNAGVPLATSAILPSTVTTVDTGTRPEHVGNAAAVHGSADPSADGDRRPRADRDNGSDREQRAEARGKSPAAVFQAAKQAVAKEDFAALSDLMTPRLQRGFVLVLVVEAGMARMLLGGIDVDRITLPEEKEKRRTFKAQTELADRIAAAMQRHGLSPPEKLKERLSRAEVAADPETARKEAISEYLKPIKDRRAFIAEVVPLLRTLVQNNPSAKDRGRKCVGLPLEDARLVEVRINGGTAAGTLAMPRGDDNFERTVRFQRTDVEWRIAELDLALVAPLTPWPSRPVDTPPDAGALLDLSGEWLMTLPAGFE